jgi:MFS family permease
VRVLIIGAVQRMKTLRAMLGGMIMATAGILASGLTSNGWVLLAGILCFSAGEMLTGPKKSEYLGAIAPPGKKGLYLGHVNIPVGIGQALGAQLSAWLYAHFGEKAMLAQRHLAEHPDTLGRDARWDGDVTTLEAATGVARTDAVRVLSGRLHVDAQAVTDLLWDTYAPWVVWLPIAAVGVVSIAALVAFNRAASTWADMNP